MKKLQLCSIALVFIGLSACKSEKNSKSDDYKAFDTGLLDSIVKPGDDFFAYVNQKWISQHPIPADKGRFGAFDILTDLSQETIHKVEESAAAANAEKGSNTQKVGDFFASGMDTVAIEKAGIQPLQPYFDKIDAVKSNNELMVVLAEMHSMFCNAGFNGYVSQDPKNSALVILNIGQGGIGMPDRDYYFRPDAKSKQLRDDYTAFVTHMNKLMGADDATAAKNADIIMKIETALAQASMTNVETRDPYAVYHKMSISQLTDLTPSLDWRGYLTTLKVPPFDSLNVAQPEFFKAMNGMMRTTSVDDWKVYLKYNLVNTFADYLSKDFQEENFNFYRTKLQGIEQQQPRWKRVTQTANFCIGEALGQEYVKVAFPEESKQKMLELVANLRTSLGERINTLSWMDDSTKQYALKKLNAFTVKVGYPDKWRDYSALEIDKGPYVLNVIRAFQFEAKRQMDKIGKPVDKSEWLMTPQTVNAYYEPSNNEIVFPAAILQPPFFDPKADDALNYGGIGVVIGHEMTHGFDDQGRQFDAMGNLKDWWTKEDGEKFKAHTQMIVDQFNTYYPLDSTHINGELTLGENIADFGGITVAYQAFSKTEQFKSAEAIDGFTPQQRFFFGYARIWAGDYKEEAMRQQLLTNPHSPGKWRVNGTVVNVPQWYEAFGIKEGDKMFRAEGERPVIW